MTRRTLTRRALLGSAALAPLLAACATHDAMPQVDPSAPTYGTLRIGYGALREMHAVAHVYAQALRRVGYTVELVETGHSRSLALRALLAPSGRQESTGTESTTPEVSEAEATAAYEALPVDRGAASVEAQDVDPLDIVIDYSGDLLLYLTDDGKLSPAAVQNERVAASVTASAAAAGVTLPPAPTQSPTPSDTASGTASPSADSSADPTASASATRSADPINLRAMTTTDMTNAISRILPEGLNLLNGANATNKDVLVTTRAVSARYKLTSLVGLRDVQSTLGFSIPDSYSVGTYGIESLRSLYRFTARAVTQQNDPAERVRALTDDSVQVTLLHSVNPAIDDNRLVVLEDPSNAMLQQQLVPIIRRTLPDSARNAVNRVSSTLDTGNLSFLLQLTSGSNPIADDDAAQFILDHPRK
ncbi:ABC transporter substrate-binding protein [Rothia sp. HMSC062F03]|uniref:glycine betaine ABC transporter substrate-binding protein n=1 Tax=Rothia sp. HMSC062F03 TaxID=1715153 RepID=UPI0008AA292C|nr:glycine betaine ABC transporter substrate-binding protein [Rothia sp. HMSC062F03]OHP74086.1 ABC transporter substrate-binding protein [Rothia sp. HMSC062F03]